jgi:deazaflavin-dependent oxidoreductase (nitroreductase family)
VKLRALGNAFPKLILSSPLHRLMSGHYLLLTFTGRKSGRSYTTPVAYLHRSDTIILTTDSPWWSNFVAGAPVNVRMKGTLRSGTADPVASRDDAAEGLAALVEAIPWYGRLTGVRRDEQGRANQADAARAIDGGRVLIRIELQPAPASRLS